MFTSVNKQLKDKQDNERASKATYVNADKILGALKGLSKEKILDINKRKNIISEMVLNHGKINNGR